MLERVGLQRLWRAARDGAVRRPAPARGHRPLPRARADPRAPRRAARRARSQAARAHEDRAEAAAGHVQHHLRLHHARPVRGARHVRPHRRDEPGPVRAGGKPARALPQPGDALRRKLRRRDEPLAGRGRVGCQRRHRRAPCRPGAVVQGQGSACTAQRARLRASRGDGAGAGCEPSLGNLPNRFEGRVSAVLFDGAAFEPAHRHARASTSPCAPCCPRRGRSRASRSARRSMWAGRRMP